MELIDLNAQYFQLQQGIDGRIKTVLRHGQYIMGPEVEELEFKLSEFLQVKHAITCANGTDALQLALMALGIGKGDAVFCPTFTFFASAEVISLVGATPVFVDIDESTYNISPEDLRGKIDSVLTDSSLCPKAIIAVDLFGLPANYAELEPLAAEYKLEIIEDSAQGFGGSIDCKMAGTFGAVATTSFFPAKPLGCYGDGGALFTDSDEIAEMLRSLRSHGKGKHKYDNVRVGLNSRLDSIQAAVLLEKLAIFPRECRRRDEVANRYSESIGIDFSTPFVPHGYVSSWAQYTLRCNDRDEIIKKLADAGIPSMIYYRTCLHQQTAFIDLPKWGSGFPVAEFITSQVFSLPMHPYLTDEEIETIIEPLH